jgi:hypothetical protein
MSQKSPPNDTKQEKVPPTIAKQMRLSRELLLQLEVPLLLGHLCVGFPDDS